MTSRLQILNYCWRCWQYGNPNFSSHIYTNCVELNLSISTFEYNSDEDSLTNEDINYEDIFHSFEDLADIQSSSRFQNIDLYFSDDNEVESEIESENIEDAIDVDNLMFGFELTKSVLDMCPVCLEDNIEPDDTTTLDCNHTFCNPCLTRIILNCDLVCALCRSPINLKNI
jgi:hypothetical protein